MSYELTIERKPSYLHAIITGLNSSGNVARDLKEILRECTARSCCRVLIEERLEGPGLEMLDVFEIALEGSSDADGIFDAIAYVDVNGESDLTQFAETVAVNRGLTIAVFPTVADAEKRLLNEHRGSAESNAAADADNPHR